MVDDGAREILKRYGGRLVNGGRRSERNCREIWWTTEREKLQGNMVEDSSMEEEGFRLAETLSVEDGRWSWWANQGAVMAGILGNSPLEHFKEKTRFICFLFVLSSILSNKNVSNANDTINTNQTISGNQTLISSGGSFELGFFSPGNSQNWYVGIWYKKITVRTVVWVSNREIPLRNSTSGSLTVIEPGILVLLNDTNTVIWSSNTNTSRVARNPVAQLLDSGNLVVRDQDDDQEENYLWQSFDYPTDTFLVGMNTGWNYVTGLESYLSSWRTNDDPAPGNFTVHLDPAGYPQLLIKRGTVILCRIGPWNGRAFSGAPDISGDPTFNFGVRMNEDGVYYRGDAIDRSAITIFNLNPSGVIQRWRWVNQSTQAWVLYLNIPADNCDTYKLCGAHGICTIGNFPVCGCLNKFVPKDPQGWNISDWTSGCVRRAAFNCTVGDGFLKYSGIKLPDARNSWHNESMTLEECEAECLRNCSCMAYTNLNISGGGSGCLLWFGDLVDIRAYPADGQDLYIRVASSELGSNGNRKKKLIVSLTTVGIVLLGLTVLLYVWKRKKNGTKQRNAGNSNETHNKDLELPLFDLSTISKATNNFSDKNKLGEGGYGPVYKGTLEEGHDIAVKRLSKTSTQGLDEFKNEVICIAKLQHRNLVKLLGCCIEGEEKMLIYEYMPNKSLDLVLFNRKNRMSLDWPKRFHIINGIARGLMYLHQDSRLRIIHRDLKASNILLDSDMNPKISDFGIAKRFKGNETEDMTSRVAGTYGYMSPEYAVHGRYSVKSDVFSFGVLVLEIVSGERNSAFSYGDRGLNLLAHAWTLYEEGSNDSVLPQANRPGFFTENHAAVSESNASSNPGSSTNEITVTLLGGR
ncbi:hypothetical protein DH2020_011370 [Rehmannia glutinosa]|uniref:Receptor-like serine/threonine-protein kinase n=1 Tax=Rehmannia glutinosa TaxID=99300 RepID=A0ABR0XD83_REHGL